MSSPSLENILGFTAPEPDDTPPLNIPPGPPPGEPTTPPDDAAAKVQARIDALERRNQELETKISTLPSGREHHVQPDAVYPTTMPVGLTPQEAKAKLETMYLADPVGFLTTFGQLIAASVENRMAQKYAPLAGATTDNAVVAFKRSQAADPMFAAAEVEFDRLLKERAATLDPATLSTSLDAIYSEAYGNTLRKRPPGARDMQPPNYGQLSGSSGSADAGQLPGNGARGRLSEEDKIYIATMRENGFSDEQIAKMMKERS